MYLVKTPHFIKSLFPNFIWSMPKGDRKTLYLTFDDGPIPCITSWVLDSLSEYNAKATFFCVGENVKKNLDIYKMILANGHSVGNHTHNHLNSWGTDKSDYLLNVARCANLVESNLFRPPYGRLTPSLANHLGKNYSIIMWDILSGDFDTALSGEACWKNVVNNAEDGSIIVLHDSLKAQPRLEYVLPRILKHYSKLGFSFCALPQAEETVHYLKPKIA